MASALLSLALNHSLDPTVAMTGELTVTGKVLRIGGLREKTVAARRAGATKIIFPADNNSDWLELPEVSHRHCASRNMTHELTFGIEHQRGHRRPSRWLVLGCVRHSLPGPRP